MAKKSKQAKAKKQAAMIEQYADYQALAKLPKDSNPNRLKNRDMTDGRPRGYMRKFGLSRITFRQLAHEGKLPGVKKASW